MSGMKITLDRVKVTGLHNVASLHLKELSIYKYLHREDSKDSEEVRSTDPETPGNAAFKSVLQSFIAIVWNQVIYRSIVDLLFDVLFYFCTQNSLESHTDIEKIILAK